MTLSDIIVLIAAALVFGGIFYLLFQMMDDDVSMAKMAYWERRREHKLRYKIAVATAKLKNPNGNFQAEKKTLRDDLRKALQKERQFIKTIVRNLRHA